MPDRFDNGPLQIGDTFLEKYQILGTLGRGAYGYVYRAMNLFMGREVAIKILSAPGGLTEELRQRGRQEAALLGKLEHPNIVRVYDAGISEPGSLYIVMELLEGQTLSQAVRGRGPMTVPQGLRLLIELCEALECAHGEKAVHRDLKPANIFLTKDGTPKILDFGVAKIAGAVGYQTQKNMVVGTLLYMSPEQIQGHPATPRSDIYALGLVAFQMFSGTHALLFDEPALDEMDRRRLAWIQAKKEAPRLDRLLPGFPEYVARLVNTAIVKPPGRRFESAKKMGATAKRYLERFEAETPCELEKRRALPKNSRNNVAKGREHGGVRPGAGAARAQLVARDETGLGGAGLGGGAAETERLFAISIREETLAPAPWSESTGVLRAASRSLPDFSACSGESSGDLSSNSDLQPLELSEPRIERRAFAEDDSSTKDLPAPRAPHARALDRSAAHGRGVSGGDVSVDSERAQSSIPSGDVSPAVSWMGTRLKVTLVAVSGFSTGLAAIWAFPPQHDTTPMPVQDSARSARTESVEGVSPSAPSLRPAPSSIRQAAEPAPPVRMFPLDSTTQESQELPRPRSDEAQRALEQERPPKGTAARGLDRATESTPSLDASANLPPREPNASTQQGARQAGEDVQPGTPSPAAAPSKKLPGPGLWLE